MTLIMVISPQTLTALVVDLSSHIMKTQLFLAAILVLSAASASRNSRKSKTLPQCVQDEDCHVSFCACCGECTKETNYRCKIQSGIDCQKKDMRVDRKGDNKMTPEERAAGSEFFKRAMSYMNDTTFDWDKENPS